MIDRTGRWPTGESWLDIVEYLVQYMADSYPIGRVLRVVCPCGASIFRIEVNQEYEWARLTCVTCGQYLFVADSEENWEDNPSSDPVLCPCGDDRFEVVVGFSLRGDDEVRWITVGYRCAVCSILGVCIEWRINYGPTDHLLVGTLPVGMS